VKQQLVAFLMQANGEVSEMPTDELLVALHHVTLASILDDGAVYEFVQVLKRTMQTAKPPSPQTHSRFGSAQ
jgi:hypothetical protein